LLSLAAVLGMVLELEKRVRSDGEIKRAKLMVTV
jgi:hypothetical protein